MPLPARQLIQRPRIPHVEHQLYPLYLLYLRSHVPAQLSKLLLIAVPLVQNCGVVGHEAVVFGADQHHLLELGQPLAPGEAHEEGLAELD